MLFAPQKSCAALASVESQPEKRREHEIPLFPRKAASAQTCREGPRGAKSGLHARQQRPRCNSSFDHLVGAGEHDGRNVQAERLGSLEINDQGVLAWYLNRQISGLRTLEDAIHVPCGLPKRICRVASVRNQATVCSADTERVHRRYTMLGCARNDRTAMKNGKGIGRYD